MNTLWQDLKYGIRMLLRSPMLSLAIIATLALGIGANTAIFSILNSVLLRPLPYAEPDRLVQIQESNPGRGWPEFAVSAPNFRDWTGRNRVFSAMAACRGRSLNLTGEGDPELIPGAACSADLLPLLGMSPVLGRNFLPEEDRPGGDTRVVLVTHGLWTGRFAADPGIVGRRLTLGGEPFTVVGVLPERFEWVGDAGLLTPLGAVTDDSRDNHVLSAFGRLKPGVTLEQAQADMVRVAADLEREYGDTNAGWGVLIRGLLDAAIGDTFQRAIWVLAGAVGFVLLIACANVTSLLLARAGARQREMAVRMALGAGRPRLVRMLLTEWTLLALVGGGAGLLLAGFGVDLVRALDPGTLPRLDEIRVDGSALAFTFALSLLASLVFGLAPALQVSRAGLHDALKEGTRGAGLRRTRGRRLLVAAEVALSAVLLIGAALLGRSFARLTSVDPGFRTDGLLTLFVTLEGARYPSEVARTAFMQAVMERLESAPGIEAAGSTTILPLAGGNTAINVILPGRAATPGEVPSADWRMVSPGYFRALGLPLRRGRPFNDGDRRDAPAVSIISESMARRFWPEVDAIGQRFRLGGSRTDFEVVGVVADIRDLELEREPTAVLYIPYAQGGWAWNAIVVRAAGGDPMALVPTVRAAVREIDPDLPLANLRSAETIVERSLGERRFTMLVLAVFATLALLLASIGVYGVMAFSVTQRTHEI